MEGVPFGWKTIQDLHSREVERRKRNEREMVPGLQESYIIRDSWTKLNVMPSKIMQVRVHVQVWSY